MGGFVRGRMAADGRFCGLLARRGPCGRGEGQNEQRNGQRPDGVERHRGFYEQAACQPAMRGNGDAAAERAHLSARSQQGVNACSQSGRDETPEVDGRKTMGAPYDGGMAEQRIVGFHRDEVEDWVADLECGHTQHVRHRPPWELRPWVVTEEGRKAHLGQVLRCKKCDEGTDQDAGSSVRDMPEGR